MSFYCIIKVELLKLYHKKTTLLLLFLLLTPLLFGAGMHLGLSFLVPKGSVGSVEAVKTGLSGMGFAANMLGHSGYILFLVIITLSSISFSGELENGQLSCAITHVCRRRAMFIAKYTALLLVVSAAFVLFTLGSLLIYALLVGHTGFASGQLFDAQSGLHAQYILFTLLAAAVAMALTFLLGARLKTFPCFAVSYIAWFASLYAQFVESIKLLVPSNMADALLKGAGSALPRLPYAALYVGYCAVFLCLGAQVFNRMDIKQ